MKRIKVLDKEFELSISSSRIQHRINEIADQMSSDMKGMNPIFIGILNGSFMFVSDLFRKLNFDAQITFLKLSSYEGTNSTNHIKQLIGLNRDIQGMDIIILEDIVDTGITLETIIQQLKKYKPASIRVACLLFKPGENKLAMKPDYIGFKIENKFVIGFGLDYNGYGRKYEDIYTLITNG